MDINKTIAEEFKLRQEQIDNTVALLDDDKTIPFIAPDRPTSLSALFLIIVSNMIDKPTIFACFY